MSSMNLRNITQTSMGKRSRSPDRPLSLRMMSRQDLTMLPNCWAVVSWASEELGLRVLAMDLLPDMRLNDRPCSLDENFHDPSSIGDNICRWEIAIKR